MSAEETAQLMQTYRMLEGERFHQAVQQAVAFIHAHEKTDSNVLHSLWHHLQKDYGQFQVMTIVNDALGQVGTRFF
jgi:hypothetical protein